MDFVQTHKSSDLCSGGSKQKGIVPGKRPPLLKGLYVAVEFLGSPQKRIVIPRKAIHEGRVYLVNDENKLEIKPVEYRSKI